MSSGGKSTVHTRRIIHLRHRCAECRSQITLMRVDSTEARPPSCPSCPAEGAPSGGSRAGTGHDVRSGGQTGGAASAWAPLAFAMFRALWIAQFASNVGTWMQTVGAQWLLIDQLAAAGVARADRLQPADRAARAARGRVGRPRRPAAAAARRAGGDVHRRDRAGGERPSSASRPRRWVLLLTFVLGCGNAVAAPAWQAIQPDLVERSLLPQAAALNGLNMNVARAVGPAIGGLVVACGRRGLGVRAQRRLVRRHRRRDRHAGGRRRARRQARGNGWSRRCARAGGTCATR